MKKILVSIGHGSGFIGIPAYGPGYTPVPRKKCMKHTTQILCYKEKTMTSFKQQYLVIFIAAITFLIFTALPGTAQDTASQESGKQPTITDTELDNAARAYTQMQVIHQEFQQSVQQTEDQDERQQLQDQANAQLISAIKKENLDVETYNHIMSQVQSDEQLREQFIAKLQDTQ
jgi:hypothetical protein